MNRPLQEVLISWYPLRGLVAAALLCRGALFLSAGNHYRGLSDICRVVRISDVGLFRRLALSIVHRVMEPIKRGGENTLVLSYQSQVAAVRRASEYSLQGSGRQDLFRDLIVLKSSTVAEKGVVLLKYAKTFDAVIALLDMTRLLGRYRIVLEPCWTGYCDPSILMYWFPDHPVFIQCFTEEDTTFIRGLEGPFVPVQLGPADWVDADLFTPIAGEEKLYDIVMVANWASHKRHALLFQALRKLRGKRLRVLLIGFPWAGRTADDIRRESVVLRNRDVDIEILERVPQRDLARHLSRSKVFVFLSRKEGDNKALVEAMFANVPAVVYDRSIGGARRRINPETGVLSSDENLADAIAALLETYQQFNPRRWALQHTGSSMATKVLDDAIRQTAAARDERYTEGLVEKTNSPNLTYKIRENRERFAPDYAFLAACLRNPQAPARARRPAVPDVAERSAGGADPIREKEAGP